jgi:DNA polymerase/3'-5' exonuclease PolX
MPSTLEVVGSFARKEKEINDIDFITNDKISSVIEIIRKKFKNIEIITKGTKIAKLKINDVPVDIFRYSNPEEKLFIKFARTNKKGENIYYRKQAKKKNMLLNDKGLYKNGERVSIRNIDQLKQKLKD